MMKRYAIAAAGSALLHVAALAAALDWPGGRQDAEPAAIAVTLVMIAAPPPEPVLPATPRPYVARTALEPPPAPVPAPAAIAPAGTAPAATAPPPRPPQQRPAAVRPEPAPRAKAEPVSPPAPAPAPPRFAATIAPPVISLPVPEDAVPNAAAEAEREVGAVASLAAPAAPAPAPRGPSLPVRQAGNPRPAYPALARERGLEGQVVLHVEVTADGMARDVRVVRSSGYASLDRAAREAVLAWRFEPAMSDGQARAGAIEFPVTFRLTD